MVQAAKASSFPSDILLPNAGPVIGQQQVRGWGPGKKKNPLPIQVPRAGEKAQNPAAGGFPPPGTLGHYPPRAGVENPNLRGT